MFGVANQLLAAVAFGVGTTVIIKSGKLKYAWVTFIPMVFMFATTLTASWQLMELFQGKSARALSGADALTFKIDAFLVFFMAALSVIFLIDMAVKFYRHLSCKVEVIKKEIDFRG
jgi:carbon starvation protein